MRKYPCPCCSFLTLPHRGEYDICPVCFWEDDASQETYPELVSGANNELCLTRARENYRTFGACEKEMLAYVRKPLPEEYPE